MSDGWVEEACYGCRGTGVCMPGDFLATCSVCHGNCGWWKHKASGVLAAYPGGPFLGRERT